MTRPQYVPTHATDPDACPTAINVAEVEGVGCTFYVHASEAFDLYGVWRLPSGPSWLRPSALLTTASWRDAMLYVIDNVEHQLAREGAR